MECRVCLEQYTAGGKHVPLVLPGCGHTFCSDCVSRLYGATETRQGPSASSSSQRGRLGRIGADFPLAGLGIEGSRSAHRASLPSCPTCRHPMVAPERSAAVKPNYALLGLLSEAEAKKDQKRRPTSSRHQQHDDLPAEMASQAAEMLGEQIQCLTTVEAGGKLLADLLLEQKKRHSQIYVDAFKSVDEILRQRAREIELLREKAHRSLREMQERSSGAWNGLASVLDQQLSLIAGHLASMEELPVPTAGDLKRARLSAAAKCPGSEIEAECYSAMAEALEGLSLNQQREEERPVAVDRFLSVFNALQSQLPETAAPSKPPAKAKNPKGTPKAEAANPQSTIHILKHVIKSYEVLQRTKALRQLLAYFKIPGQSGTPWLRGPFAPSQLDEVKFEFPIVIGGRPLKEEDYLAVQSGEVQLKLLLPM